MSKILSVQCIIDIKILNILKLVFELNLENLVFYNLLHISIQYGISAMWLCN